MTLRNQHPGATARFLQALADSSGLSAPETIIEEPGFADIREHIRRFFDNGSDGRPLSECLQPWVGGWSIVAALAANHGCSDEWLRATSQCLAVHLQTPSYAPVWLDLLLCASVPLVDSLPAVCGALELDDAKHTRAALENGANVSEVVGEWESYSAPLNGWLVVAEKHGAIAGFHSQLADLLLKGVLSWPTGKDFDTKKSLSSSLSIISFGLNFGIPLPEIVHNMSSPMLDVGWWHKFEAGFHQSSSLADAYGTAGVLTPFGCALIKRAEQAGNLERTLLECCARIQVDLLFQEPVVMIEPDQMDEWIEGISIRGRMAYGLLCIETACREWAIDSAKLKATVEVLWEFTSSKPLDVWDRKAQSTLPYTWIEATEDDEDEGEKVWRGFAEYCGFSELPDHSQDAMARMLSMCLRIGIDNLYSGYQSFRTAKPLIAIINIMRIVGLTLPSTSRVSLSRADEKGGWGEARPREFFL